MSVASTVTCLIHPLFLTEEKNKFGRIDSMSQYEALSQYEEQRLRNISQNQEILARLGLDEATLKRDRPEQSRPPRAPKAQQQKCVATKPATPTTCGSAIHKP